jgi:tRNA threonylcarbamoyladenosine biosynthesis protein TsaB
MAYLALDCTGETFSCGLLTPKGVFTEVLGLNPRRALLELPAHISHLLHNGGLEADDVQGVGVPVGPGSFTGVRLGIALAKTVAFCSGCEVYTIDTLECLARQHRSSFSHTQGTLAIALDARRKELYCGLFSSTSDVILKTDVRTPEKFQTALSEQTTLLALVGAGFAAYPDLVPSPFLGPVLCERSETALSMHTLCNLTREAASAGMLQAPGLITPAYHRRADIQVSR